MKVEKYYQQNGLLHNRGIDDVAIQYDAMVDFIISVYLSNKRQIDIHPRALRSEFAERENEKIKSILTAAGVVITDKK